MHIPTYVRKVDRYIEGITFLSYSFVVGLPLLSISIKISKYETVDSDSFFISISLEYILSRRKN